MWPCIWTLKPPFTLALCVRPHMYVTYICMCVAHVNVYMWKLQAQFLRYCPPCLLKQISPQPGAHWPATPWNHPVFAALVLALAVWTSVPGFLLRWFCTWSSGSLASSPFISWITATLLVSFKYQSSVTFVQELSTAALSTEERNVFFFWKTNKQITRKMSQTSKQVTRNWQSLNIYMLYLYYILKNRFMIQMPMTLFFKVSTPVLQSPLLSRFMNFSPPLCPLAVISWSPSQVLTTTNLLSPQMNFPWHFT